jgi:1-acyl-sn-glycerol-3-phosphate acyltransferase
LGPFKKGAFVMAINTGVPLVPVAILGSDRVMPKGRWTVKGGEIVIRIGEDISTDGFTVDQRDRLTRLARERILALKAGSAGPSGAGTAPGNPSPYPSQASKARASRVL